VDLRLRPSRAWIGRLPPRTVRLRLTLLYGALFLLSGAILLAITYLLVRQSTSDPVLFKLAGGPNGIVHARTGHEFRNAHAPVRLQVPGAQLRTEALRQHAAELHQLLVQSGIALAITAALSVGLGWLVAGRALRPLRTMTATARRISEHNLNARLALEGPRDELRDLADTIDGLLTRLESAFGAQRRFVANAAHELRTPLTLLHALVEETLTDPSATLASFRSTSRQVLAIGEEQERLLEALLTLASTERDLDQEVPFDLSVVTDQVLLPPRQEATSAGVQLRATIEPAPTTGDPILTERLIANLLDNAIRYNVRGGWVEVSTGTRHEQAVLSVTNTGPRIPAKQVDKLFEPFRRAGADRTGGTDGHHGLGLSIVRAIATAHNATITTTARPEGGLHIEVNFPRRERDTAATESSTRPSSQRLAVQ
jgi:signal transduction histidine kinase